MLRALFSVVTVLLLAVIAFLLTSNYLPKENLHDRGERMISDDGPLHVPQLPVLPMTPRVNPPQDPIIKETGLGIKSPEKTKSVLASPPSKEDSSQTSTGKRTHVVRSGDTLWSISNKYFGTPTYFLKIADINHLKRNDCVRTGQVLVLPTIDGAANFQIPPEESSERLIGAGSGSSVVEIQPPTLSVIKKKSE